MILSSAGKGSISASTATWLYMSQIIEACAVGAPFSGPCIRRRGRIRCGRRDSAPVDSRNPATAPCLEISAAAGLYSSVKQSFECLPLYFGPRLAERLLGRLQIGVFAGENPPDFR
jgi:hypothetical protein